MVAGIDVAKKLGLNEYESKAYVSLLKLGLASASKLSSDSSIPRARIYDVLASLEKKGFVEKKPVKPVTYSAVLPTGVVKKIESVNRRGFEESIKELLSIAQSLESQVSVNKKDAETGDVVLVSGWDNIFSKIMQKLSESKEKVFFSTTSNESIKRKKQEFARKIAELENRGIDVKFKRSNSRYVLFDDDSVLVFLNPPSSEFKDERAILLENSFVAGFFKGKKV